MTQPVERRPLLDELTDRILAHIRDEKLGPGDRLPSNRALSERFMVATPTLREALRRLEATGTVELRHGSGVYLRADLSRLIMINPHRQPLDRAAILDLLEARELIEPHLAESAARNATDEQVAELADSLAPAAQLVGAATSQRSSAGQSLAEDQRLHTANMNFHRTIARLAGNRALAQVLDSLVDLHDQEQRQILTLYRDRDHDYAEHQAILDAVRRRTPKRARRLMLDHLQDVRTVVTRALDEVD